MAKGALDPEATSILSLLLPSSARGWESWGLQNSDSRLMSLRQEEIGSLTWDGCTATVYPAPLAAHSLPM